MKTITNSLLAIAVTVTAMLSCNKSDITPAATNATTSVQSSSTAQMSGEACGMHCTCNQAQWGTDGRGNDLIKHYFVQQFPSGFPVGSKSCGNGFIVWVKDASALKMMLPMRGAASVLTQDYKNGTWPNNSLVGELIALCCNIDLEHYDPMFHAGMTTPFADMKISSGTFQGLTVMQFFKVANDVLGGCNTMYTPQEVNNVAKKINDNYLMHGKMSMDNGYLMCP